MNRNRFTTILSASLALMLAFLPAVACAASGHEQTAAPTGRQAPAPAPAAAPDKEQAQAPSPPQEAAGGTPSNQSPSPSEPATPQDSLGLPGPVFTDELFMAQEWQARGNLDSARQSLRDALARNPGDGFTLVRLAQLDAASGDLKAALDGLTRVLSTDSGNLLALRWQGHVLLALGHPDEAEKRYQLIRSLDPTDGWPLLGLAACRLARGGDGTDAETASLLLAAQAAAGDDAELHFALADTFTGLNLPINARLEIERYLEARPRDPSALTLAGEVYLRLGLESLALDAWRQALDLDKSAGWARFELLDRLGRTARRFLTLGRRDEAERTWRIMLTYDPLSSVAIEGLRELHTGDQGQPK